MTLNTAELSAKQPVTFVPAEETSTEIPVVLESVNAVVQDLTAKFEELIETTFGGDEM
jgi:hypothetical protein